MKIFIKINNPDEFKKLLEYSRVIITFNAVK